MQALAEAWPAEGKAALVLNVASEGLLRDCLAAASPPNFALEVPAFMAADEHHAAALAALHARGHVLYLKGRPAAPLPAPVLACFKLSIIEFNDDRRDTADASGAAPRSVGFRAVGRQLRQRPGRKLQARRAVGAGLADRRAGGQRQRQDGGTGPEGRSSS